MKNEDIIQTFNKLKSIKSLHTEIYDDGCIERTGFVLENFPESRYILFHGNEEGNIKCKDNGVQWHQHYVPFLNDENGNVVVMDISLLDGPETLEEYMKHFENIQLMAPPEFGCDLDDLDSYKKGKAFNSLEKIAKLGNHTIITPNAVKSKWLSEHNGACVNESIAKDELLGGLNKVAKEVNGGVADLVFDESSGNFVEKCKVKEYEGEQTATEDRIKKTRERYGIKATNLKKDKPKFDASKLIYRGYDY